MSDQTSQPPELSGYQLDRCIGSGGYGEVWSAEAPGGLHKAIKFVYGDNLGKRATRELESLEKIKGVRHPFILSLERIEVVEDRLAIVTELADGSLRERFQECVQQGLPGIPRDELLRHLAEAADALDFLGEEHNLAHLDIKPENLLLVAGHIKVADFGLVKSISNMTQASLVGGMTPTYAAPEVYQSAPTRKSDQYSLAILYQEMLNGTLPFNGATCAELTMQHVNCDPNLSSLSETDRFILSRALAKDPEYRYDSAGEMVAALIANQDTIGETPQSVAPEEAVSEHLPARPVPDAREVNRPTVIFDEEQVDTKHDSVALKIELKPASSKESVDVADLPTADLETFSPTPTLFLGIGGSAAKILRATRGILNDRYGINEPIPTLPMLLIDTDPQELAEATREYNGLSGLSTKETLELPLRKPSAYREKSADHLQWINRRWLYNIPKTLRTEGIRPLGRLALVDHARRACQRIRIACSEAISTQSHDQAEDSLGFRFKENALRVVVVASASGGTGSGMSLDLAYAVRTVLQRLNIQDAQITGLITHATPRDPKQTELARINACSWLSELNHYQSAEMAYPGDYVSGLPGHEKEVAPFDQTYFIRLGESVDEACLDEQAHAVAQYLVADSVSPLQTMLNACRRVETNSETSNSLRSFSLWPTVDESLGNATAPARQAAWLAIQSWRSGTVAAGVDQSLSSVTELDLQELTLNNRGSNRCLSRLDRSLSRKRSRPYETTLPSLLQRKKLSLALPKSFLRPMLRSRLQPESLIWIEGLRQAVYPYLSDLKDRVSKVMLRDLIEGAQRPKEVLAAAIAVDKRLQDVLQELNDRIHASFDVDPDQPNDLHNSPHQVIETVDTTCCQLGSYRDRAGCAANHQTDQRSRRGFCEAQCLL